MIWFTSDTHFLHGMVAGLRGFASSEEHDEEIIGQWNRLVRPDDLVWHLGDVGLGNETRVLEQAARLNGRKQLITGNHDACWPGHRDSRKHQRKWLEVFESVQQFAKIRLDGETVLLSHFPYEGDHTDEDRASQFRLRDEGMWLLHGHTHMKNKQPQHMHFFWSASLDETGQLTGDPLPRGREIHVGLDAWDLSPVSENALSAIKGAM